MVVPLATSVILTCAPGMTASLASLTLPEIVPRASCALAVAGAIKTIVAKTAMANACNNFDAAGFIYHPPNGWKTKLQPLGERRSRQLRKGFAFGSLRSLKGYA